MVIVLSKERCQACKMAKKILEKKGVPFIEVQKEEREDLLEKAKREGALSFPVFFDSRENFLFSGFYLEKISSL